MTIPVTIIAGFIAAAAAVLIAVITAWGSINSRLGKLEKGQETLAVEIRATRERSDMQHTAAEERADVRHAAAEERAVSRHAAAEERAVSRHAAAEERAVSRHNELLTEIRLWRTHGHDADGTIFFRVPE
jgi:biopolymer transport protein ExbB/TolQ